VYNLENYENLLYMVMEDFGGESLDKILFNISLNPKQFLQLAISIITSLGKIHERNIIHKDINPSQGY